VIKPTIGLVVWYWSCAEEATEAEAQARPGLVCYVYQDGCINVAVFDRNGDLRPSSKLPLFQGEPGEQRPNGPHCEWMPYQKGQASKQEAPAIDVIALATKVNELEAQLKRTVQMLMNALGGKGVGSSTSQSAAALQAAATPQPPPQSPVIPGMLKNEDPNK
jgi:hypothetical protein